MNFLPASVTAGVTDLKIDDINAVITATNQALTTVKTERKAFDKATEDVTAASFGGYQGATVVVEAHTQAHGAATATLDQVTSTLELFAIELGKVLATTNAADELSESGFRRITEVSQQAADGTTTPASTNGWTLNNENVPKDGAGAHEQPPATGTPEVCTPEGEA